MIIGAFALVVGLTLYTLLDALRTHQDQMRTFPKWLWIIAVIFFPVVGPLLWLLLGRPDPRTAVRVNVLTARATSRMEKTARRTKTQGTRDFP